MVNRSRGILLKFYVSEKELEQIRMKMEQYSTNNLSAYLRKIAIDGYVVNLELPELSYIAVNVRGCRAYVQVRERIPAPEIVSKQEPGNTVAAKDALVTAVQPWDGEKMVLPRDYDDLWEAAQKILRSLAKIQ